MEQTYLQNGLTAVQKLCALKTPFQHEKEDLFVHAMAEITSWHYKRNPFYRNLLDANNYNPENIKNQSDLDKLPLIHADFFKKHASWSIPEESIVHMLTSSGTSGQKSQMAYDSASITALTLIMDRYIKHLGWDTPNQPCNYLLLSYQPHEGQTLGTAYSDNFLCKYAPINKLSYALQYTGEGHTFDQFGSIQALLDYEKEDLPVRIFGFPSFLLFILESMEKRKISPLKLHPNSLVNLGGGWKKHVDKQIDKSTLYQKITDQLGIHKSRIRDGFGSVEHCMPYFECPNHHFHMSVWGRARVLDLKTLAPLDYGREGFLNLQSPYPIAAPTHNILMSDLATIHPGKSCECGISTDYFEIIGRAGTQKNRSCAIAASELISKS